VKILKETRRQAARVPVLRWGLIGAGDIARKRIAPALRDLPNCEFVSVSRADSTRAEEFAKEFGAKKWFADWRELVKDDEIDAVYIATPVYLHVSQAIAAANAGKHVLCEKPMALNVKECDEMLAACKANNVKLGIAYYRRFYPVIERIKQLITSGKLGKIAVVQINAFEYFEHSEENSRRWLIEKAKSGGGPLIDFGCHRLEVLTHLFGDIQRTERIVSNSVFGREVEDTATVLMQFANGTNATLTVTHAAIEPQDTLDIYGTKGSIHVANLNKGGLTLRIGNEETIELHPPHSNIHLPLIEDFTESILNNREPKIMGETGREINKIIEEIYAS
jgi:predicted dehydrogenase